MYIPHIKKKRFVVWKENGDTYIKQILIQAKSIHEWESVFLNPNLTLEDYNLIKNKTRSNHSAICSNINFSLKDVQSCLDVDNISIIRLSDNFSITIDEMLANKNMNWQWSCNATNKLCWYMSPEFDIINDKFTPGVDTEIIREVVRSNPDIPWNTFALSFFIHKKLDEFSTDKIKIDESVASFLIDFREDPTFDKFLKGIQIGFIDCINFFASEKLCQLLIDNHKEIAKFQIEHIGMNENIGYKFMKRNKKLFRLYPTWENLHGKIWYSHSRFFDPITYKYYKMGNTRIRRILLNKLVRSRMIDYY